MKSRCRPELVGFLYNLKVRVGLFSFLLMSISRKGISWSCSHSMVNWILLFNELMKRRNSCWRLFGRAVKQSSTYLSQNKGVQGGLMKICCSIFYMVSSLRTTEIIFHNNIPEIILLVNISTHFQDNINLPIILLCFI